MAEAAAFKLLAPLATDLLKKGYSYLGLDVDVDEKLHDLQNIIVPKIEMAIEAAENYPHKDRLRGWLKSMEEAVYEAEDVLDEQDYYLLEQKVKSNAGGIKVRLKSLPPIKYLSKNFNIKLKRSLEKLEKTAVKAKEFLPSSPAGSSNVTKSQTTNESGGRDTTSRLPHEVVVFGRDKERDNIVDLLHETTAGDKPSVVAIVGVGGAGKTTLAQYICKHEREADPKYFDVIMWVHVSQIFDVKILTKEMVESASRKDCPNSTNLDVLQSTLEDSIRSKKFLLVLDDVWIEKENVEMELEKLLAPLSAGKRGSKILMTTREKGVADALRARNIVPLEELKEDDFFAMFWHYAVGDTKNDDDKRCKELENIMRKNKLKLHGSPLAARVVGSRLRNIRDVDSWKRILSGDLLKDTMKSLLWSYQNLDAPLQRCFSYCSLFRKGDNIEREELIHLWIAEGFIKSTDESKRIEDVGQDYFDDLLSSSFFQPTKYDGGYIIHDLLHDLAETVSKDRCRRVEGNLTNTIPQEIRHLSLHHINRRTLSDLVEKICNLKNLRTLIIFMRTSDDHILHSIFVKLKKLRVVHLKIRGLQNLPESIGGLKHLRYLYFDESNRTNLPKSIYTLYHLEFLYICECRLEAKALANWINLQHLYFNSMIVNVVEINCWKQLWNQRKFHGRSIDIEGLENVKEKREVTMDVDIERLRLVWSTTDNNSRSLDMDVQVLEGFHLTPKLHDLTIVGYRGCVLPSWMVGDPYFLPNIKCLKLYRCRRLKQLLIVPPTLRQLELDDCSSLPIVSENDLAIIKSDVRISQVVTFMEGYDGGYDIIASELPWDEQHGYDSQKVHNWLEKTMDIVYQNPQEEEETQLVLPSSLEYLYIKSCPLTESTLRAGLPGLTSLVTLEINNIISLSSLPSADVLECLTMLKYLTIGSCWFLTSLGGLQALRSLTNLFISFCPNLSAEGGNTSVLPSSLECLKIKACHWKNLDDSQPDLTSSIHSESSDNIPFAASLQLGHLKLLTELSITNCPNIGSLLGLQELNNLKLLTLIGCPKLAHAETKLGSLEYEFNTDAPLLLSILLEIVSLPKLCIKKFKKESFRSEEERVFQHLTSLETLWFENCNIKSLPNNLETLSTLTRLDIYECPNIKSLPDLPRSLETLSFKNCSIKSLPNNLETLSTLTRLDIYECPNIKSLPDLPRSLIRIKLTNCNWVLKRRCQEPHGKDWPKIAHIPDVSIYLPEYGGCFPWLVEIWGCMEWLSSLFH